MKSKIPMALLSTCLLALTFASGAAGFAESCSEGACADCHTLTTAEAETALKGLVDRVVDVRLSEVPGLYAVDVEKQAKTMPMYLDFSKQFLIYGDVVRVQTRESLTRERMINLNRVDAAAIPTDDAVVIGKANAKHKIVVFDDPECPYCKKLHVEMKKLVAERSDVAFLVKMLPLKIHPNARQKAEAIICAKSLQLLDDSLAGKPLPEPSCETDQVEKNEALARDLGVRSTPTLIFPDGRVVPGAMGADKILEYLQEGAAATPQAKN